ncbi:efflux RND transporter periplasmic adaptor subunit [Acidovorax sp. NCPPB 3859]|nr:MULTISPECIES: efflux RND transporter periplasmic adaptor subunit [unclassified Acidovorax]MDA8449482.1 efflux RND transporter periplasmic adaptor subunit [Acidovorax sp. GBBC 3297]MDA8458429.1 efflux RND transporter periplasmic adaptor subunit [Acidovorax sp. GBBC 3333]MDA8463467.1 efflux RND transporter periplasmic adaptor subunit [Acidovorax sp. GBBC 3332]MDA8468662.1 efflux RND transporter periplasmic adaptor subunit [Acidovorax sp. GBBC 3299]WCM77018.1 efflux RND transporter periplasmic
MNSTPFRSARRLPVPPDSACPPPPAGCAGAPGSAPGSVRQAPGRRARTLWLGLGIGLAAALAGCSDKAPPPAPRGPVEVGVVTLQPERQSVTTELPGRTSAYLVAEIRPQVGGIVQKRLFTEGAEVKAGQALYQLDPAPLEAALASAEASLSRAQATAASAESNARRNAELAKIEAVSRQVADDSQAAAQQSRSDVTVARAAVATARINLGYARIQSPISGRTTTSSVTPGALVTANQTTALTTVSQVDPLYVDVTQSSTDVLRWKTELAQGRLQRAGEGQARMRLKLEDGSTYAHAGRLQFSGITVNPTTGAVTLRGVVPNPDGLLMPGMYVRAVLETGVNEQALLVPQQGVARDAAGNASVLVANAQDKVERRGIQVGAAVGNRWVATAGLTAGDRIIVDGLQRIQPGDAIHAVEVKIPQQGAAAAAARASAPAAPASAQAPAASR